MYGNAVSGTATSADCLNMAFLTIAWLSISDCFVICDVERDVSNQECLWIWIIFMFHYCFRLQPMSFLVAVETSHSCLSEYTKTHISQHVLQPTKHRKRLIILPSPSISLPEVSRLSLSLEPLRTAISVTSLVFLNISTTISSDPSGRLGQSNHTLSHHRHPDLLSTRLPSVSRTCCSNVLLK